VGKKGETVCVILQRRGRAWWRPADFFRRSAPFAAFGIAKAHMLCAALVFAFCTEAFSAEAANPEISGAANSILDLRAVRASRDNVSSANRVAGGQMPVAYFLEQMPDSADALDVPHNARDVIVAKVTLHQRLIFLGEQDISGASPKDNPKDIFFARVKIEHVLKGHAAVGQLLDVRFGPPRDKRDFIYPVTTSQIAQEYVVAIYLDADDKVLRLAPFPIRALQHSQWEAERSAYTRTQSRPGVHQ
jgi:hypothetical protein